MANNSIKILVIDDLQDNLITLNALIKDAFPEAITLNAQSGKKGLGLAAKENPDVILLDILMPGMDGYEVCQILKADKKLCDIPVVFVTAIENTKEALVKALESGGEAFLTKPIDEIELTAQIRSMLKIKEANNAKKGEKIRLEKLVEERSNALVQELDARKRAEKKLKVSEATVRKKLKTMLEPEGDVSSLELSDIIDAEMLHSIMEDFYQLTGMLGAVLDVSGKVLVSVGWQDICTKFHRCHPDTLKNCLESDTVLTEGVAEGEYKSYRCKNNMWDIVTPIMIGGKHLGNVFMGQYFLEGEVPDIELFRKQAKKYGFDEAAYLYALDQVPCFSKETVEKGMRFYSKLGKIISTLSYSSIQQSRVLAQQMQAEADLLKAKEHVEESEEKFRGIYEQSPIAIEIYDKHGKLIDVNQQTMDMFGVDNKKHVLGFNLWADPNLSDEKMKLLKSGQEIFVSTEFDFEIVKENKLYSTSRSGKIYMDMYAIPLLNDKEVTGFLVQIVETTERKKGEETLKESQNLLQQAENISNQGSWKWDIINDVWSFSENWLKIHGFEHSGISREELMKIAHPDDNSKIDIAFENALSDNKPYSIEHRIIRKDSHAERIIKATGEVHFSDNGKPDFMIGIAQDITDRKQAEEKLRESEERFELAMNASNDGLFDWDLETNEIYYSPAWKKMIGYEDHELPNDFSVWETTTEPEDVKKSWELQQKLISKQIDRFVLEFKMKHNDGHWVDILSCARAIFDDEGKAIRIVGTHTDITERKQFIKTLKERNEYIEFIMENMPIGFALNTIDDGDIKYMNDRFEEIYGWSRDILTNTSIFFEKVFPEPEYREKMQSQIIADMESGDPKRMHWDDLKIVTSAGEVKFVHAFNIPLIDQNLMISTVQDVTNRKLAEEELAKHRENLEELVKERTKELKATNKELETFTYSVSHDLRAPIRSIDGFTKRISEEYATVMDEEGKRLLNIVLQSTKSMGQLIDDLLAFSRLGRQKVKTEQIHMEAFVKDVISELTDHNRDNKSKITIKQLPDINADKSLMRQVVINLLTNAIKFTKTEENAVIEIGSILKNDENIYYVKDQGVGFDMKYIGKIFDVFQRLHSAKEFEGTGVGLAIVQRVIHQHNGKIWAEAEVNKGATFYFTIGNN